LDHISPPSKDAEAGFDELSTFLSFASKSQEDAAKDPEQVGEPGVGIGLQSPLSLAVGGIGVAQALADHHSSEAHDAGEGPHPGAQSSVPKIFRNGSHFFWGSMNFSLGQGSDAGQVGLAIMDGVFQGGIALTRKGLAGSLVGLSQAALHDVTRQGKEEVHRRPVELVRQLKAGHEFPMGGLEVSGSVPAFCQGGAGKNFFGSDLHAPPDGNFLHLGKQGADPPGMLDGLEPEDGELGQAAA
jgi:hypothetical protein